MTDDSDQELSDLEIEKRTWNKLEKNMKSFGFREGAAKGKESSLQEGFNLGYLDGFKLGKSLGTVKGIIISESKLKLAPNEKCDFDERVVENISTQTCILCSKYKATEKSFNEETFFGKFENLISAQQSHGNDVMKILKNLDGKSYLDNG